MAYLLGEEVQLGVGPESTRGTAVAPSVWIPGRKPTSLATSVAFATIRETRGSGILSAGTEVVQARPEGDFEFNIRNASTGYILKALLGSVSSVTALGATTHTFTRLATSPQNPSLTFALAQPGQQDYEYPMGIIDSLAIKVAMNDLVHATAKLVAKQENTHADYTPAFDDSADFYFRPQDVTIKFASDVAGLSGASAVCLQELNLNINGNSKPHQCIGSENINDIFSMAMEISGSFSSDYDGATAYYDVFTSGGYKAMEISMERTDLAVIGTSALKPKVTITLPRITFSGYKPNRSIDDIVKEGVEFKAHYDTAEASAITVVLQNEQANYTS